MRLKSARTVSARALTALVLARPGTPSMRMWPRVKMPINRPSISSRWPTSTLPISSRMRLTTRCFSSICAFNSSSGTGFSFYVGFRDERAPAGAGVQTKAKIGEAPWVVKMGETCCRVAAFIFKDRRLLYRKDYFLVMLAFFPNPPPPGVKIRNRSPGWAMISFLAPRLIRWPSL